MTPKLSDEQRQALDEQPGAPIYVEDPVKGMRYVLISAEAYQRVQAIFAQEPFDVRETYPALEQTFAQAGWDDPAMDAYDDYDAHRSQP